MKVFGLVPLLNKEEKAKYIDFLKGVAIILMLWGHVIQYTTPSSMDFFENPLYKIIYSFHMPVLMGISGYLFSLSVVKYDLSTLIQKKIKELLWPLVVGSVLNYYITTGLFNIILGQINALFNGEWIYNLSSLWFIWSVFSASMVVAFSHLFNTVWMRMISLLLGFVFIALFPNAILNIYMYPYFLLGFFFSKIKPTEKLTTFGVCSLLLFPIGMSFFKKEHFIYTQWMWDKNYTVFKNVCIDAYRYIIAIMGCCFFSAICFLVFTRMGEKKRIKRIIEEIGRKSLQVYVVSVGALSGYLPKIASVLEKFFGGGGSNCHFGQLIFSFPRS